MLQRKQTIFLALAALLAWSTWLFPVATYRQETGVVVLHTYGIEDLSGGAALEVELPVPFHVIHSVLGAVLVLAIFLFKNRPRQLRVVRGTWLIALTVAAIQFISSNSLQAFMERSGAVEAMYGLSFYLPLVVLVLALLAERAIKADEELVRSADRLR